MQKKALHRKMKGFSGNCGESRIHNALRTPCNYLYFDLSHLSMIVSLVHQLSFFKVDNANF